MKSNKKHHMTVVNIVTLVYFIILCLKNKNNFLFKLNNVIMILFE